MLAVWAGTEAVLEVWAKTGVLVMVTVDTGSGTMVEAPVPGEEAVFAALVTTTLKPTLPLAWGVKVTWWVPVPAVTVPPVTVQA